VETRNKLRGRNLDITERNEDKRIERYENCISIGKVKLFLERYETARYE
jgi:hypothetical protein